jgi:hypothetical protein
MARSIEKSRARTRLKTAAKAWTPSQTLEHWRRLIHQRLFPKQRVCGLSQGRKQPPGTHASPNLGPGTSHFRPPFWSDRLRLPLLTAPHRSAFRHPPPSPPRQPARPIISREKKKKKRENQRDRKTAVARHRDASDAAASLAKKRDKASRRVPESLFQSEKRGAQRFSQTVCVRGESSFPKKSELPDMAREADDESSHRGEQKDIDETRKTD